MHLTLRKSLIFIGKLVVSAAMLWFVFSNIETDKILQMIRTSNPWWLLAATVLFMLSKMVSAFRLNLFFRCAGLMLPTAYNLRLYLLGMFYNLFLPGGVGGDAYKVILLKRSSDTKLRYLIQATLLDRVTGLIALVIITLILLLWLPLPAWIKWCSAASVPVVWFFSRGVMRRFFNRFLPIFLSANTQSAAVQLLQLGTAWCILMSIGFQGSVLMMMTLFLVSSVMAVIPVTFGGAGAREFTFALASTFLAFDAQVRDHAITLGLVFYLITAVVSLAGLWYVFFLPHWPDHAAGLTDNTQG
jgi:glycosyltransferase 2 family protein